MVLDYLDFDYSDGGDGGDGDESWDAMACVLPARLSAALREVEVLLAWAHTEFGAPGEWREWDFDLQCQQDGAVELGAVFLSEMSVLHCQPPAMNGGRCTLTLTLRGSPAFGAALRECFSID